MQWSDIIQALPTLIGTQGGYSKAQRGLVTLPDKTRIFVKIGVDENTKQWARKEIAVYDFLSKRNFPFIPKLLAYNEDRTGFALEPLTADAGWDWTNTWNDSRLLRTLQAMDALAAITPSKAEAAILGTKGISESADGWNPLAQSTAKLKILLTKLQTADYNDLAKNLDVAAMAKQSSRFVFASDAVVHNDIRADNCAWHTGQQTVKCIDWNWAQLGDRSIDLNAMLVHVHQAGLNILTHHAERLSASALQWLAGFWLNAAATPLRPGASEQAHLRDYQLEAGVSALGLLDTFQSHRQ